MNPQLKQLIELQKIDTEIAELEKNKASIPQQIQSGTAGLRKAKSIKKSGGCAF